MPKNAWDRRNIGSGPVQLQLESNSTLIYTIKSLFTTHIESQQRFEQSSNRKVLDEKEIATLLFSIKSKHSTTLNTHKVYVQPYDTIKDVGIFKYVHFSTGSSLLTIVFGGKIGTDVCTRGAGITGLTEAKMAVAGWLAGRLATNGAAQSKIMRAAHR